MPSTRALDVAAAHPTGSTVQLVVEPVEVGLSEVGFEGVSREMRTSRT